MLITAATSQEQDRLLHAVGHSAEEEKRSIKGEFDRSSPTWTIPNSTGPRPRDAAPPTLVQKKLEFLVAQHSHPAAAQTDAVDGISNGNTDTRTLQQGICFTARERRTTASHSGAEKM